VRRPETADHTAIRAQKEVSLSGSGDTMPSESIARAASDELHAMKVEKRGDRRRGYVLRTEDVAVDDGTISETKTVGSRASQLRRPTRDCLQVDDAHVEPPLATPGEHSRASVAARAK